MKKLIAQRPIQYMGRTYERGDTLPAHEAKMVKAWVNAGTAAWQESGRTARNLAELRFANDHMAADTLRRMGVVIDTPTGEYVGDENLEGQIRALCRDSAQECADGQDGKESTDLENNAQGEPVGAKMLDAHLDAEKLATWKNAELEKLAADLGVDISGAKNKAERAQLIAATQMQVSADDPDSGGDAQ